MATIDKNLEMLAKDLDKAYDALSVFGAQIPQHRNTHNLEDTIYTMTGGSGLPEKDKVTCGIDYLRTTISPLAYNANYHSTTSQSQLLLLDLMTLTH